jgi:hypothetical protein
VSNNSIVVYWNAFLVARLDSSGLENRETPWTVFTYDLVGARSDRAGWNSWM